MTNKPGRPALGPNAIRSEVLRIRVTVPERKRLEREARKEGFLLGGLLRRRVLGKTGG